MSHLASRRGVLTSEERILKAKADAWSSFAGWLGIVWIFSLVPLFALFLALAKWAWGLVS